MDDLDPPDHDLDTPLGRMRAAIPHLGLMLGMVEIENPGVQVKLRFSTDDGVFGEFEARSFLEDLAELIGVKDCVGWAYGLKLPKDDEPEPNS